MIDQEKAEVIIKEACDFFQQDHQVIKSRCRKREYVLVRQFAEYFMRKSTTMSLEAIGSHFNHDHATVLHSIRTVNDLIEVNGYASTAIKLESKINIALNNYDISWCDKVAQL